MFAARSVLVFALLPLFAGCQLLGKQTEEPKVSTVGMLRMQGDLTGENGQLLFKPCNEQRRYVVKDRGNTGILQEAASLADSKGTVFADLRGSFAASKAANSDGQLDLHQLYRVERPGQACEDLNFKRLTLHVNGNKPAWNVNVSGKGMVLSARVLRHWRCPTWKRSCRTAVSASAAKPTTSASRSGSRHSAASTASTARCNTSPQNCA